MAEQLPNTTHRHMYTLQNALQHVTLIICHFKTLHGSLNMGQCIHQPLNVTFRDSNMCEILVDRVIYVYFLVETMPRYVWYVAST